MLVLIINIIRVSIHTDDLIRVLIFYFQSFCTKIILSKINYIFKSIDF